MHSMQFGFLGVGYKLYGKRGKIFQFFVFCFSFKKNPEFSQLSQSQHSETIRVYCECE